MYDWNGSIRSLNVGLPDDIARLKAAGYYQEAIARIDRLLAEDWTKTQNGPASNGIAPPEGYVPPENPTPHGVDALREALTVQKEIMRRLPGEYCWTEAEAIARMQERVRDFTAEEFKKLDWEGRMDWRFVEGEKRYQARFAETLLATHADLAARKLTPDAPNNKNEERHRLHEKMEREGSASADITLRTSIRMSDEAFAATEAAYERLPKSARADKDKEEKPADSDQGGKPATKASTEIPLRSDAGVRPHDVDDRKVSLEDRLRDGFMAAYRNRVGEDSPEHSQINA